MKKNIILFLLLITSFSFGQSRFIYKVKLDTLNDLYQKKKSKNFILASKYINKLNFILNFDGLDANYYMEDIMESENSYGINQAIAISHGFKYIYINSKEGMAYFKPLSFSGNNDNIVIADSINKNWVITNEKKTINNFECYKAIGEIKITKPEKGDIITIKKRPVKVIAWFSPQIPVPLGPKGFGGLPGLILELKYDKFFIRIDDVVLSPKRKIRVKKISGKKYMSEADYSKMIVDLKLKELEENGIDINKL